MRHLPILILEFNPSIPEHHHLGWHIALPYQHLIIVIELPLKIHSYLLDGIGGHPIPQ